MLKIPDAILREFGDEGADTLDRYVVQLEYTALWCAQLLHSDSSILSVIPEGVEDVVIEREGVVELRQIKTRDESQGPWRPAEILPFLAKLYCHRRAFPDVDHQFHFVSDRMADTKTQLIESKKNSYGPLFRLKELLDILHARLDRSPEEEEEYQQIVSHVGPRITELMKSICEEDVPLKTAIDLIGKTWIETDTARLRSPDSIGLLGSALEANDGAEQYSTGQVREIHGRLLLTIIQKIRKRTLPERRTTKADVLACCGSTNPFGIDLKTTAGTAIWEKKALLGGFDQTELPAFNRQRLLATAAVRQLLPLGYESEIERLITDLVDRQVQCRDHVCRTKGVAKNPGPEILAMFRRELPAALQRSALPEDTVDEHVCLGLAWQETDQCTLWWHGFARDAIV